MKKISLLLRLLSFFIIWQASESLSQTPAGTEDDSFIWLEDMNGPRALEWVKTQDSITAADLENDPNFRKFHDTVLTLLDSQDRIPYGRYNGKYVYNFWQDSAHIKGIVRRATLEEYFKTEPQWETVLDIDKLSTDEGKDYIYKGSTVLHPDETRGMVALSIGGTDAVIYREFDYESKSFVQDGFFLPDSKGDVAWYDRNTLLVGTDFGPGSMTTSGYPRISKMWKRGTPLSEAKTLLEGDSTDVSVSAFVDFRPEGNLFFEERGISFWQSIKWLVDSAGNRIELPFPRDSYLYPFKGRILARLNSDWQGIPEGTLVALKVSDLKSPEIQTKIEIVYKPDSTSTISDVSIVKDYVVVTTLRNVRGHALYFTLNPVGGTATWAQGEVELPVFGAISIESADNFNNSLMIMYEDFLTPPKLYFFSNPSARPKVIKQLPAGFNAKDYRIDQLFATSKDGTSIPYFMVSRRSMKPDSLSPTLLYGYGGFRGSQTPFYSRTLGKIWYDLGGVYVLANIRGGGEFGPRWHKAGLLENRQKVFDDFTAVAEDLINRKITSPEHLGIMGGSNGGLLVGVAFTQHPELFKAVVCQVPLLDMLRYTKLGAGASWIGEFGDPNIPAQRAFIEKYSPYQNLKAGVKYPRVFFETSTADDRVHPGHARKMAAKMEQMGYKVYFYEEMSGGHSAGADNLQTARRIALEYTYLWKTLK